jgi:hypothetical protein
MAALVKTRFIPRSSGVPLEKLEVIAAEQIKAEEQQRLIGVIPNFYGSPASSMP